MYYTVWSDLKAHQMFPVLYVQHCVSPPPYNTLIYSTQLENRLNNKRKKSYYGKLNYYSIAACWILSIKTELRAAEKCRYKYEYYSLSACSLLLARWILSILTACCVAVTDWLDGHLWWWEKKKRGEFWICLTDKK